MSNVTINHLKRALELSFPLTWVQNEMHPLFYEPHLLTFCKENAISVQAWAPLARGRISHDAYLLQLGEKYKKTVFQIALKWIIQHACIPLPGSSNKKHIKENQDIWDFSLSNDEMKHINEKAQSGPRQRITSGFGLGFTDEFDFTYEQCWPKKKTP